MSESLRTVLVGAGRIGAGYANDELMAQYIRFATHAQVLDEHPDFTWIAVVDPSATARERVRSRWDVPLVTDSLGAVAEYEPEVAVLAIPPQDRMAVIQSLPTLRGVLLEKPLGSTEQRRLYLDLCRNRQMSVQVNLWRRADEMFRGLAAGGLHDLVGGPQAVTGVYGNGLLNNGVHVVDFLRMLIGDLESVQTLGPASSCPRSPVDGDVDVPFGGRVVGGTTFSFHPLGFDHYREVSLDIWGEEGRLSILQEGLAILAFPRRPNRAAEGEREVASDEPIRLDTTVGSALYHMYTNLATALRCETSLWSSGDNAVESTHAVDAILESAATGRAVHLR